jgi:hypothetical protein
VALAAEAPIEPHLRMKTLAGVDVFLRLLRCAIDCFPESDLESMVVFLSVVAASAGGALRDPEARELARDAPLPERYFRAVSRRAIAEATGLPREVVRRRIAKLIAKGELEEFAGGVRPTPDVLGRGRYLEFARTLVSELASANGRISRYDEGDTTSG